MSSSTPNSAATTTTKNPIGAPAPPVMQPKPPQAQPAHQQKEGITHTVILQKQAAPLPLWEVVESSVECVCPYCHNGTVTLVERKCNRTFWCLFFLLSLFFGWLGCCLIACCFDASYDHFHYCGHCGALLGRKNNSLY